MKTFLLIDTYNFLHRAYHALPSTFRNDKGEATNAVYGVTSMLLNVLNTIKPHYVVSALDSNEPTFRSTDFISYKAHRKPIEDDLASQIPKVIEILDSFGIKNIEIPGYEADDVIGTLVKKFSKEVELVIVSNDRDLWQLVGSSVKIMVPTKEKDIYWVGPKEAEDKFGFNPSQIPDFKGLRGDPSDNIPGVYGIGEKIATKLIQEYGSVENMYRNLKDIQPESLRKKLEENYEQALMSKKLAEIILDVPLTIDLEECKYNDFNRVRVKEVLQKYNFKSLIKRLGFDEEGNLKKDKEIPENQIGLF